MRCEEVRAALGGDASAEVLEHVDGCGACQTYVRDLGALGALLDTDEDEPVRPGFDTRFFARLEQEKRGERRGFLGRMSWLFAGAAAATAALAGVVVWWGRAPTADLSEGDVELALHLELAEDLELVRNLEEVEVFELLAEVDDLDRLLEQGG